MKLQYLPRWALLQGAPRLVMTALAHGGDAASRLYGFPHGTNDPYRVIADLRSRGRMIEGPLAWTTTDHQLSREILRNKHFGVVAAEDLQLPWPLSIAKHAVNVVKLPLNPAMAPAMLVLDAPDHPRMRKPVASAFTPRAIERLRHRVASVTAELLDDMREGTTVDLVSTFAARVPVAIIAELLGFPEDSRELFLRWGTRITPLLDVGIPWGTYRRLIESLEEMNEYLDAHIEQLRRAPGEDILSTLVGSGELDDIELKATACLLLVAGFETTVNLISNATLLLLNNPSQLAELRANPDLWPNAVEEVLRFDAPVQITARIALSHVTIDEVRVPKGTIVMVSLAGAGRDPKVFDDPDRFDVTRANAKDHITFSSGVHVCLGASLARMEATHALRALFDTFPDLRLNGMPRRRPEFTLNGLTQLPVHLGDRASARDSPDTTDHRHTRTLTHRDASRTYESRPWDAT